ncbi:CLUMA_CG010892, isoform A [Clunio marinus]|uniref:CLUMA_CG010892, isoform A n=1 Tax=Clunio marinus TaxID=568069 RepID=A0A1J1IB35_9DIPT|nr:CLUMA_CG010892, isoform A [Clunio marinus]
MDSKALKQLTFQQQPTDEHKQNKLPSKQLSNICFSYLSMWGSQVRSDIRSDDIFRKSSACNAKTSLKM